MDTKGAAANSLLLIVIGGTIFNIHTRHTLRDLGLEYIQLRVDVDASIRYM